MAALISNLNQQENIVREIPEKHLRNTFDNNDSVGMIFSNDGKFFSKRNTKNFDRFYEFYQKNAQHPGIVFFPKAPYHSTAGNKHNSKMFVLTDNLVVFHEGYWTSQTTENFWASKKKKLVTTAEKSIMQALVEKVFRPAAQLDENIFKQESCQFFIKKLCDWDDKLVFFYSDGSSVIFNEEKGKIRDGIWYSNTDFENVFTYNRTKIVYPGGTKKIVLQQQGPRVPFYADQQPDDDLSKYYERPGAIHFDGDDDEEEMTEEEKQDAQDLLSELLDQRQREVNLEEKSYDYEEEMKKYYGLHQ